MEEVLEKERYETNSEQRDYFEFRGGIERCQRRKQLALSILSRCSLLDRWLGYGHLPIAFGSVKWHIPSTQEVLEKERYETNSE